MAIRSRVKSARTMDWFSTPGLLTSPYGARAVTAQGTGSQAALIVNAGATPGDGAHEAFIYQLGERTVTRIRGDLYVSTVKSTDTSQDNVTFFGIAVVPWEAYDAGFASMPSPFADPEYDWLYWRALYTGWRIFTDIEVASASTHLGGDQDYQRIVIDSKAQRKMRKGELPVALWYNRATGGTADITLGLWTRTLLKQ